LRTGTLDAKSGDKGSGVWRLESGDYWLALGFFALGLMSKPMLVTLPVILLLLDFWPLKRISNFGFRISDLKSATQPRKGAWPPRGFTLLLFEKLPFLALSLASSIVTFRAQSEGGAVVSLMKIPWYGRALNSLVFYTAYLEKMFWPVNLSVLYQYQRMEPWEFIRDALLPVLLSVLLIRRWRSQPYLFTGWLWFLVMLVPVIGLVQVGGQSIADRYTYLPSIGLFILVAWAAAELAQRSRLWQTGMTLGLAAVLAACLADTRFQLRYWRDSITLFRHAVEVTRGSYCYFSLGNAYLNAGNLEDAAGNYRIALQLYPNFPKAHYYFGNVLLQQKKYAEAREEFDEVLRTNPEIAFAHKYLGDILAAQGKYDEAAVEYITALQLKPDDGVIRTALALATQNAGIEKALTNLFEALKTRPTAEIHAQIAALETTQGTFQDAVEHFHEALRLKPDAPDVLNNLAWLLATCPDARIRDGAQAVKQAERACALTQDGVTPMVGTLAAAYAEAGRFDEAISTAEKACALAKQSGEQNLLQKNQELLQLYRAHKSYHEPQ
jgi:tetratricopeptide (TPR) repeat protein